jgi:soluble lytic murein transglycosylase-like protein
LLGVYIRTIFIYFIWIVGLLAVVMVIWGGVQWIMAAGNPTRISAAREHVTNAIIGVVIALTSVVLLNTINPNLTNLSNFHLISVEPEQIAESEAAPDKPTGGANVLPYIATIAAQVKKHPDWIAAVRAQATTAVPAERIFATIFIESSGNPSVKSPAGAVGLMQLLPSTAAQYGYSSDDLLDPLKNIAAGSTYLKELARSTCPPDVKSCSFGKACRTGDFRYIHAAYNGGRKANTCSTSCPAKTYSQCDANPRYQETRNYVINAEAATQWIVQNNFPG